MIVLKELVIALISIGFQSFGILSVDRRACNVADETLPLVPQTSYIHHSALKYAAQ